MVPILEAARDLGIAVFLLGQDRRPFPARVRQVKPLVAVIGDDIDKALGPAGFHRVALRKLINAADNAIILSAAPDPAIYATATAVAGITRRSVVLIETRPEQEIPWGEFIQKAAPSLPLLIVGVEGGTA